MPLHGNVGIHTLQEQAKMEYHELTARTYVNAAKDRVVDENDPEAAFLLGPPGELIPKAQADALGLTAAPPDDEGGDDVEDKMVRGPRSAGRPPRTAPKDTDAGGAPPQPAEGEAQPAPAEPQPVPPEGGA